MSKKNRVTFQRLPGQKTLAHSSSIRQRERDRNAASAALANEGYGLGKGGRIVELPKSNGGAFLDAAPAPDADYVACPDCGAQKRVSHRCVERLPAFVADTTEEQRNQARYDETMRKVKKRARRKG